LGFLAALVDAAFSVMGTETVLIAAAESANPHRSIPKAAKRVALRIGFFYFLGAFVVGLIIDPRNPELVTGGNDANGSPFIIAMKQAGISVLPSVANAGILVSACSAGNSYAWVSSRLLVAMTTDRQLPQIFGRANRKGVPYIAVGFVWLFGLLAYLSKPTVSFDGRIMLRYH
jgi:amino acid transporter